MLDRHGAGGAPNVQCVQRGQVAPALTNQGELSPESATEKGYLALISGKGAPGAHPRVQGQFAPSSANQGEATACRPQFVGETGLLSASCIFLGHSAGVNRNLAAS
jgi:hypothetical protein